MRNITTSIVVALTLGIGAFPAFAETEDPQAKKAKALYNQGILAMRQGKYDLAKANFRQVLKIYPGHSQVRQKLIDLSYKKNHAFGGRALKNWETLIIPKIDMVKMSLSESMDLLLAHIATASKDKIKPNIIVQDPSGEFADRTVTLTLRNVPARTLLRYILEQAGGTARFDKHAIVVSPR